MVVFDLPTLLAITVFTSGLAGCLLLLSWLQHRMVLALALWGSAFIIAAIATTLIIARNSIPDLWSIVIGNAMLAAAYGIVWSGVRNFEGKEFEVGPGSIIYAPPGIAGAHEWEVKESLELLDIRATNETNKKIQYTVDKKTKRSYIDLQDLHYREAIDFKSHY